MFTCVYVIFFIVGTVFGGKEDQAKLRYYHNDFENYTELTFDKATEIFATSWYNSSRLTVIFAHGFTGHAHGAGVTGVIKEYLGQRLYNVALLNWDRLATPIYNAMSTSYFNWAVPNSIMLGVQFADVLLNLTKAGLDLNKMHLVGHSLGAHIMGLAGNRLVQKGIKLPWITGLDPAGFAFDSKSPQERINPDSAHFVEIIHSDPNKYGSRLNLGTVDFWPNYRNIGKVVQPGCTRGYTTPFSSEDLCDHHRSWQLLVDAIRYPGTLLGSYARNFRAWKNYSDKDKTATVLEIGKFEPDAVPGNYYLLTTAESPFGRGQEGL